MKLIKKLERYQPPSGAKPYYRGMFECPTCGEHVIKSLANGKKAKTCGSNACNPNQIYHKGSRSLTYTCEVCEESYEQQKRLYAKAKWKNRCPNHRFSVVGLTDTQIAILAANRKRPIKHFSEDEIKEARKAREVQAGKTGSCLDCGTKIWKGADRCRQCSNKKVFFKGNVKRCLDCNVEIHRKATRCKNCFDKIQDQGKSKERVKFQNSRAWNEVRTACFERDNYTCQHCNIRGSKTLSAHHIKPYRNYPELRLDLDNLLTLCHDCHYALHANQKGEDHYNTKLTDKEVHEVFQLLILRKNQSEIAKLYGVSSATISNLNTGRARHKIYQQYKTRLYVAPKKRGYNRKLTLEEANQIRIDFRQGLTRRNIAEKYRISRTSVSLILRGRSYVD